MMNTTTLEGFARVEGVLNTYASILAKDVSGVNAPLHPLTREAIVEAYLDYTDRKRIILDEWRVAREGS